MTRSVALTAALIIVCISAVCGLQVYKCKDSKCTRGCDIDPIDMGCGANATVITCEKEPIYGSMYLTHLAADRGCKGGFARTWTSVSGQCVGRIDDPILGFHTVMQAGPIFPNSMMHRAQCVDSTCSNCSYVSRGQCADFYNGSIISTPINSGFKYVSFTTYQNLACLGQVVARQLMPDNVCVPQEDGTSLKYVC
eukprot:PhM_4_TR16009/c0_g1_i1/m.54633